MANSTPFEPEDLLRDAASIRGLSRALIKDRHLAEDVAQEAVLRVARAGTQPTESRAAWLRTIVLNAARTMTRSKGRRAAREAAVARQDIVPSNDSILEREEARRALVEGVLALEEPYRSTVILRYLEELSLGDVALRMGVPKETVRTRCKRGLETLRLRLDGEFGGSGGTGRALGLLAIPGSLLPPPAHAIPPADLSWPANVGATSIPTSATFLGLAGAILMKFKLTLVVVLAALLLVASPLWRDSDPLLPSNDGIAVEEGDAAELASVSGHVLAQIGDSSDGERATVATESGDDERVDNAAADLGSLRVSARWSDGSPAAGVALLFTRREPPRAERHPSSPVHEDEWVVTDGDGHAQLTDRWPGLFWVQAERAGEVQCKIRAGEETRADLVLERGTDIDGRVVDARGNPVGGAEVFVIGWRKDWRNSRPVTKTSPNGRFQIRSVGSERSLGAVAPKHGPSNLFDVSSVASTEETAEVVLALTDEGARLVGVVRDPAGEAVRGALVTVVTKEIPRYRSLTGNRHSDWATRSIRSDELGEFVMPGLPAGSKTVAVLHPSWPQWRATIELEPRQETRLEVDLEEGSWVFGTVTLADGTPAASSDILVLREPFDDPFPLQGPTDQATPFLLPQVVSTADGSFEIGPLPAAAVHLHASLGTTGLTPGPDEDADYRGMFQATLQLDAGERREWNPVLSVGGSIRGRVTFADGTPIFDAFVTASKAKHHHAVVTAEEDGTFIIPGLEKVPHDLWFQLPFDAPKGAGMDVLYGVMPSKIEHVLTADYVPEPAVEPCTVRVKVEDTAGLAGGPGKSPPVPMLTRIGKWSSYFMHAMDDGAFQAVVTPGHLRLVLMVGNTVVQLGDRVEARSGDLIDLGTIRTTKPGSLLVTVQRPTGAEGEVKAKVRADGYVDSPSKTAAPGETSIRLDRVTPGILQLELSGAEFATAYREVELESGETTTIEVAVLQGAKVPLEFDLDRRQGFRHVQFSVTSPEGHKLTTGNHQESYAREWPIKRELTLAPGSYRVEIMTSDGQTFSETLVVDSTEAREPYVAKAR